MARRRDTYWLADEARHVIDSLMTPDGRSHYFSSNPFAMTWARNSVYYYSPIIEPSSWDTSLVFEGEQGELVRCMVPQAQSMIRQLVTLLTKQKLAVNAMAEKHGSDVVAETKLGNALGSQIIDDTKLDLKQERITEAGMVEGMAFLKTTWRTDRGDIWAVEKSKGEQRLIYTGEPEVSVHTVVDTVWDYTIEDWDEQDWVKVRVRRNRWSLIAQFPELKAAILALPEAGSEFQESHTEQSALRHDDNVWVHELYARKTPALPNGRMLIYSDRNTIYYNGKNLYGEIPIRALIPQPVARYCLGMPLLSYLLPAQEMFDHTVSAIATNSSAFAVQNVLNPRGANIGVQDILGMRFISYTPQNVPGGGEPKPLNLLHTAPETFKFLDLLQNYMQNMSNLNAAIRGEPPPGVTSGVAIATLTTNAIEFLTSTSKALKVVLEDVIMDGINAYRRFASTKHIVYIAGRNFETYTKKFVGTDLDPIRAVKLVRSNPIMQTIAGRTQVAEMMISSGQVKTPQDLISIMEGEPLDKLWDIEKSENDLIQTENERLMDGEPVRALSTDNHPLHVRKHAGMLNDANIRMNSEKAKLILDHIQEHLTLAKDTDPFLTAMVRTGTMPELPPPKPPGGGGGAVPGLPPVGGEQGPLVTPTSGQAMAQPSPPAEDLLGRAQAVGGGA